MVARRRVGEDIESGAPVMGGFCDEEDPYRAVKCGIKDLSVAGYVTRADLCGRGNLRWFAFNVLFKYFEDD